MTYNTILFVIYKNGVGLTEFACGFLVRSLVARVEGIESKTHKAFVRLLYIN